MTPVLGPLDVVARSDRRPTRRARAVLGLLLLVALAGCAGEEQGGLQAASPGPDATVGGEIDRIELLYDDIVVTIGGEVVGPDGESLDAEFVVDGQIRVLIELGEPLVEPGRYVVRSDMVSAVGHRVGESYGFTFEPGAAPPRLVFPSEDSGSPWLIWTIAVVGAIVLVVLIARLLASMRRLRTPTPDH